MRNVTGEQLAQVDNPDPFASPVWRSPVYRTPEGVILIVQLARFVARAVWFMVRHPLADVAAGLLERLHAQLVRHQFRLALRAGRPQVSLREHLAIIEAVCNRRQEEAGEAAQNHLRSVIGALRENASEGLIR